MDGEDAYLLDLCDAAIGQEGLRQHELSWLRERAEPDGPPARVDAWYPQARAVVLLTERKEEARSQALASMAVGYGVDVLEVPRGWIERDAKGVLRRLPREAARIDALLGTEAARRENRVWPEPAVVYSEDRGDLDIPLGEWDEEAGWADEGWDDEGDEDGAEQYPPEPGWREFQRETEENLGWRGRAVALALLEAVTLSRRAFAVERTEAGLSRAALEALLVLLVTVSSDSGSGALEPEEFERLLNRAPEEVGAALGELEAAGLARPLGADVESMGGAPVLGVDVEWDWVLLADGRHVAAAWIARTLPMFPGWPPDVRDVDDLGGP